MMALASRPMSNPALYVMVFVIGFDAHCASASDDWHAKLVAVSEAENLDIASVFRTLGPPDHVQGIEDSWPWPYPSSGRSVWLYGSDSAEGLPIKGRVCFDEKGRVVAVVGEKKRDEDILKVPSWETHLRRLWELRTTDDSSKYDPLRLINAINLLKEHSKEEVFKLLAEYCRLTEHEEQEWIPLALRCLFRLPKGTEHPDLEPEAPRDDIDAKGLPVILRYPVLIVQGVPFVINAPKGGGGRVPGAESVLTDYRKTGELDRTQLLPTNELSKTREQIMKSTVWKKLCDEGRIFSEGPPHDVFVQCFRLAKTAFTPNGDAVKAPSIDVSTEERWISLEKQLTAKPIEWSPLVGCYVLRGAPPRITPPAFEHPKPKIFFAKVPSGEIQLTLEREEFGVVSAYIWVELRAADVVQEVVMRLTTIDGRRTTLKTEVLAKVGKGSEPPATHGQGENFDLPVGDPVDVEISINGWVVLKRVVTVGE